MSATRACSHSDPWDVPALCGVALGFSTRSCRRLWCYVLEPAPVRVDLGRGELVGSGQGCAGREDVLWWECCCKIKT